MDIAKSKNILAWGNVIIDNEKNDEFLPVYVAHLVNSHKPKSAPPPNTATFIIPKYKPDDANAAGFFNLIYLLKL